MKVWNSFSSVDGEGEEEAGGSDVMLRINTGSSGVRPQRAIFDEWLAMSIRLLGGSDFLVVAQKLRKLEGGV